MLVEIKVEFAPEPHLQEVVVERFLGNADLVRRVLQRKPDDIAAAVGDAVVQFAPERDLLDDFSDAAFLGALGDFADIVNFLLQVGLGQDPGALRQHALDVVELALAELLFGGILAGNYEGWGASDVYWLLRGSRLAGLNGRGLPQNGRGRERPVHTWDVDFVGLLFLVELGGRGLGGWSSRRHGRGFYLES